MAVIVISLLVFSTKGASSLLMHSFSNVSHQFLLLTSSAHVAVKFNFSNGYFPIQKTKEQNTAMVFTFL